ncbi:tyrosine-type recombinase/integrase [Lutimaribacter sp. EGI FJ00015]|uniref:Tyrosine-type recombinase/integrase n=1 Tax=Lutimaribacter degradans TaxID=2945989 RepID=A0ACC5ZUD0_9RHOB|nr:tyrosine-type recombinase/integrase [Lutimaribacter sp. EGI FJ00013]MCM2561366.1 tyrosine-type recombinase/integrase [Lutimaribacter sp. EGI FJ00013]MCO0611683.1 tyrosine-type recombinase/integrase [Lutimaribacter sp. EGI FJ00015]MCO0635195.1 tyrosine-type recombinase/integrase [Lutimaribacter sp. EGI FJ00014]
MTVQDELQAHISETGESRRSLSLRAGLSAKAVSDILCIEGLKPRYTTLVALSEATGRDLLRAASGGKPLTFGELVEKLEKSEKETQASRIRWIMRKANWYDNKIVCRHDVIDFFARHNPVSLGISKGSRSTYKSDILSAIDRHGVRNRPHGVADIGGIWADAYKAAKEADIPEDCRLKAGPFFVFIHDRGLKPEQVTSATLADYYAHRLETGTVTEAKCRKHVANVVTLLRHLGTNPSTTHLGFAAVASPLSDRRDKFGVGTEQLADLLHEFDTRVVPWAAGEISRDGLTYNAFLEALDREERQDADQLSEIKAKLQKSIAEKSKLPGQSSKAERVERRESKMREYGFLTADDRWSRDTIATRRGYVISLAKALAASHDIVVPDIRTLTDYQVLQAAAAALFEANGGRKDTGYLVSLLKAMKKIAVGYAAASEQDVEDIRALIRFYETGRRGIAPKNKTKLREFTEPRIQATIDLSGTVMTGINAEIDRRRKAKRKKTGILPDRLDAIDLELARDIAAVLAHDILLTRAPRSSNVIEARLDWIAFQDGKAVLSIPAPEVKGRKAGDPDYVVRLGERATRLMRNYIEKIRPKLVHPDDKENPHLFPRQEGGMFEINAPYRGILKRVTRLLHQHVGVQIHPHLYRHLIGWIWLKESMDNLPRVQRLLGHKSLQTTVEYYAELDETLVMDGWQAYLEIGTKTAA